MIDPTQAQAISENEFKNVPLNYSWWAWYCSQTLAIVYIQLW
jgi:hypothetical protein